MNNWLISYKQKINCLNLNRKLIFSSFFVVDMRRDVQEIFRNTPHSKQVMMFSATLSKDIRPVCKKFMQDVIELIYSTYCHSHKLPNGWKHGENVNFCVNFMMRSSISTNRYGVSWKLKTKWSWCWTYIHFTGWGKMVADSLLRAFPWSR